MLLIGINHLRLDVTADRRIDDGDADFTTKKAIITE